MATTNGVKTIDWMEIGGSRFDLIDGVDGIGDGRNFLKTED